MYAVVVGAGKVGWNLARELIQKGNELTLVESDRQRYATVEEELEHAVQFGDGSELWVLERAGIERADMVVAVTGDDEDNILICQVAREKYGVERVIAQIAKKRYNVETVVVRVLDPARASWYEQQGLRTVCPTKIAIEMLEDAVHEAVGS